MLVTPPLSFSRVQNVMFRSAYPTNDQSTPRSLENALRDAVDGLVSNSAFVKIACIPSIARICQPQIVRIIKQLLMDPTISKLSQTRQLISCLVMSVDVQFDALHDATTTGDAAIMTSLNEQVSQLLIIFKSRYFNLQKSSEQFRIGCFSDIPKLIGNCCNSWTKSLSFSKGAARSCNHALSHLISYLEGILILLNPRYSAAALPPDIMYFEVDDFLSHTLSYCIKSANAESKVGCSRDDDSATASDVGKVVGSFHHCRLLLSFIIVSSDKIDRDYYLSAISFSLGSNLSRTLKIYTISDITEAERFALELEIAYVIAMASIFIFPLSQMLDHTACEKDSLGSFSDVFGELYEVMSFATSMLCCILPSIPYVFENSGYLGKQPDGYDEDDNVEVDTSEFSSNITKIGANFIPRVSINLFVKQPLYELSNISHCMSIANQCVDYLLNNIPESFEEGEHSLVEAFEFQVDHIFHAFNLTHRSSMVSWSDNASNPRTFFSFYLLQCALIRVFCRLVENTYECPEDYQKKINHKMDGSLRKCDTIEGREDEHHIVSQEDKSNNKKSDSHHESSSDVNINSKQCISQFVSRGEAYSLINSIARRMFRRIPNLFLQILTDAVTCALSIEVEKEVLRTGKIHKDGTAFDIIEESPYEANFNEVFNEMINEHSSENNKFSKKSNKNVQVMKSNEKVEENPNRGIEIKIKIDIVTPLVELLLDVSEQFGATLSQLLSASIKSENYFSHMNKNRKAGRNRQKEMCSNDHKETSVWMEVGELGSGYLASAIILNRVTHSHYSQEVSTYVQAVLMNNCMIILICLCDTTELLKFFLFLPIISSQIVDWMLAEFVLNPERVLGLLLMCVRLVGG